MKPTKRWWWWRLKWLKVEMVEMELEVEVMVAQREVEMMVVKEEEKSYCFYVSVLFYLSIYVNVFESQSFFRE